MVNSYYIISTIIPIYYIIYLIVLYSLTQDFTKTTKEFHLKFEKILNTLSSTWTLACYRSMTGFYHFQFLHTKGRSGAAFSRHSPCSPETPCTLQGRAAYQCAGTLFLHFDPLLTKFINLTSAVTLSSLQAQGHCLFQSVFWKVIGCPTGSFKKISSEPKISICSPLGLSSVCCWYLSRVSL